MDVDLLKTSTVAWDTIVQLLAALHGIFGGGGGGGGGAGVIGVCVMHMPLYNAASSFTFGSMSPNNRRKRNDLVVPEGDNLLLALVPAEVFSTFQPVELAQASPCRVVPGVDWWLLTSTQHPSPDTGTHLAQFPPILFISTFVIMLCILPSSVSVHFCAGDDALHGKTSSMSLNERAACP